MKKFKDIEKKSIVFVKVYNNDIFCSQKELTSLEGCPEIVNGNFDCRYNYLTSLKGCPKIIDGDFYRNDNNIKNLQYSPEEISGKFYIFNNNISSLKYCTKKIGSHFNCKNNPELKNVKEQIIKYQIKAKWYITDDGTFKFEDIKEEFEKYGEYLLKEELKKNKNKLDYGLSIF